MKTAKSLLLGTAAGFVALTGAQAADLPLAEPVEYVKICDTYGKGYFYIPGTDTCLKISGYVRAEARIDVNDWDGAGAGPIGFDDFIGNEEARTLGWFSRGDVRFDARSETEWGTLRSYIEIRANRSPDDVDDSSSTELYLGFIQFAGFTIGRASSFYDFLPYNHFGDLFSDRQLETVAYTASFSDGFAATIAVEDKANRADLPVAVNQAQAWPNIVAALRVDQAWGSAQVSAAVQDNEGEAIVGPSDDLGWAVQAGVSVKLPTAEKGSLVWAQGAYSEGAVDYALRSRGADGAVVGQLFSATYTAGGTISSRFNDQFGGENNELWVVGGGARFQATKTIGFDVAAIYWEFDEASGDDYDLEAFKVLGKINWTPVDNLYFGAEVGYAQVEEVVTGEDAQDLSVIIRAQRSF